MKGLGFSSLLLFDFFFSLRLDVPDRNIMLKKKSPLPDGFCFRCCKSMHTCKVLIEYSAPSPSLTLLFIRFYRGAGINCWQSTGLVIQRLRVRLPAGAAAYFFFPSPELTLCADSHSVSVPPRVTAVARKRPRSLCQKCRWPVTPKHAYTFDQNRVGVG